MTETLRKRRKYTAREGAEHLGLSERYVRQLVAQPREEWLADKAAEREAIRAYHDDAGHTWPQTAEHFGLHPDTVKRRAYTARKERAAAQKAHGAKDELRKAS